MRFSFRIFVGYFLIMGVLGASLVNMISGEIKPTVRQSAEDILAETANVLAEVVRDDLVAGKLDATAFSAAIRRFAARQPRATIWGIRKDSVDLRVYVTDADGHVLLDSTGEAVGQDYSQWRDVYLTLRGEYGARSSPVRVGDEETTIMYVAAPIVSAGKTIGVLTVAKPNYSMQPYIERAYEKLASATLLVVTLGLALGIFFSYWLSRGINVLTDFARHVSAGGSGPAPDLPGNRELTTLSKAIGEMRDKLEGKSYVEQFVHGLAHELRSPLTGIQGSAEHLAGELSAEERARFIGHIQSETTRMQVIVDRLLDLARVDQRRELQGAESVSLDTLVESVGDALAPQMAHRGVTSRIKVPGNAVVRGEKFLLEQALRNLWQNALDHSPDGATIEVDLELQDGAWAISLRNAGEPIPAFALPRLFERFYSLPKSTGAPKGHGLGLPLAQSIAKLHRGKITVGNDPKGGVTACFSIPVTPP